MSQLLSARRGSVSAPDPFGERTHLLRPSSSTLTIVRLPSAPAVHEPQKLPGRRFAISFSQSQPRQESRTSPSSSPSSSPRIRPSSPHRFSQGIIGKPRLSAEQVVELARQAKAAPGSSPQSPVQSHRPQSPPTHSPTSSVSQPQPATFTPLPDDIFLPFIHRAEEVSQLISGPPTVKLFSLLRQAFNNISDDDREAPSGDPAQWSNSQLLHHLTKVDRDVCSDADWVFAARKCIVSHSELIWERVKAALGVPPELDVEDPEEFPTAFEDDESAIADSPLVGRVAHFSAGLARHLAQESGPAPDASVDVDVLGDSTPYITRAPQSPALSGDDEPEDDHLTFEPLLSTSASIPTPVSLPPSLGGGLGDIAEGAEDEEEEEANKGKEDDDLINPSQIQGLRISTGCKSADGSVISSPVTRPSGVRSSSFSDLSSLSARDARAGLSRVRSAGHSYRRARPVSMPGFDPKEWDVRGAGNPLFPSSFARLAQGPTLRAK